MELLQYQWILIFVFGIVLFLLSPFAKTRHQFFRAITHKKAPNSFVLTGSLIISWIFAKSITNAANLGAEFGWVGGIAYAAYYLSFAVAGIIIFQLRTKGGFQSIHEFLSKKFGKKAIAIFSILIVFRLFNEIWSNTMVIGNYFGAQGTSLYYWAIIIFTAITLAYTLKGGLSSSIFTDTIQMILFSVLLIIILQVIFSSDNFSSEEIIHSGTWGFEFGVNLFLVAIIQSFSYPFHDPVLTDRGFLSSPKITRNSFLWASVLGALCIFLFSFIGIFAQLKGIVGDAAVGVGKSLGIFMLLIINFIMITSAASTLDSTFSSFSKLIVIDLKIKKTLSFGRWMMILMAIIGTIPVFFNAKILSATTISGTMVIGLTPIFLLWNVKVPKISFYLAVFCGLIFGFLVVFDVFPARLIFTKGKYAALLWTNVWGIASCFILFLLPLWIQKLKN